MPGSWGSRKRLLAAVSAVIDVEWRAYIKPLVTVPGCSCAYRSAEADGTQYEPRFTGCRSLARV